MGTDKALLEVNGISLLDRAITTCEKICDSILISSNRFEHQHFDYPVVADEIKDCGPIGGIYSCLKKSETYWNMVLSVDSPFVEPEFLKFLMTKCGDGEAVVSFHDRGKEPLIAFYSKTCQAKIEQQIQSGNYKMHQLIELLDAQLIDVQPWLNKHPNLLRNLNHPDDL